jgi:scyllo-inositol 2-dehydrogenase (NADP+)
VLRFATKSFAFQKFQIMQQIKTALLSFGMSGKVFHAPFINLHKGFQLAGAWERSKQQIEEAYPGTISYPSMESILSDESIQLVIVNTPTNTHYDYAKAAMLAGKNVIVEKAFTTTVSEAIELDEIATSKGVKISVFQNRRWDSDFKTVQKIKASGVLGDIIEAEFRFERFKPAIGPKQHKENAGPGAGLLNDLGPHIIDQALCLFGMPKSLQANIRTIRAQSQVDDWFDIALQYSNLVVRLKSSLIVAEQLPGFILHGNKGSFAKSRTDVQEVNLLAGMVPGTADWGTEPEADSGTLTTEKDGQLVKEEIKTEQGDYYDYYDGVYHALTTNLAMPVTSIDGINVMKIIDAARRSNCRK